MAVAAAARAAVQAVAAVQVAAVAVAAQAAEEDNSTRLNKGNKIKTTFAASLQGSLFLNHHEENNRNPNTSPVLHHVGSTKRR